MAPSDEPLETQSVEVEGQLPLPPTLGRKKTSMIWNYFTKIEFQELPKIISKCSLCRGTNKGDLTYNSQTTSNLMNHLKAHHPEVLGDDTVSSASGQDIRVPSRHCDKNLNHHPTRIVDKTETHRHSECPTTEPPQPKKSHSALRRRWRVRIRGVQVFSPRARSRT